MRYTGRDFSAYLIEVSGRAGLATIATCFDFLGAHTHFLYSLYLFKSSGKVGK